MNISNAIDALFLTIITFWVVGVPVLLIIGALKPKKRVCKTCNIDMEYSDAWHKYTCSKCKNSEHE